MSQPEQPEGHDDSTQDATDENELCVLARRRVGHFRLPYASIQRAVRNSCGVCMVFDKAILAVVDGCLPELLRGPQDENERTTILDTLVVLSVRVPKTIYPLRDDKFVMTMEIGGREVSIEFFQDRDDQPEFMLGPGYFAFPPRPSYGPTTCSDRSFERARGWLRACLEHHDCEALAKQWSPNHSRPPKRLLYLRPEAIRLFHTDTGHSHFDAPYVCLSHRWGDTRHRRLTSTVHTIQEHSQGIPWDDLPRTFQDAVIICRRMSIEYLWIDSLCILQEFDGIKDDEASLKETQADFARENSLMATIYQNSLFTISANISTNMDSGIFTTRSYGSQRISIVDSHGVPAYFRIRQAMRHDETPTDLETRGWTLQEYILPPRILTFGDFDVTWRCQKIQLCECQGIMGAVNGPRSRPLDAKALPADGGEDIILWWRYMVELYSSRKLSNGQDKLPALSGLAQLYHAATGHTYSAGLWQEMLYEDLCWYHSEDHESFPMLLGVGRRPRQFRSPSWSWASLDACGDKARCFWWSERVPEWLSEYLPDEDGPTSINKVCTIVEVNCKPRTNDAFGEIDPDAFIEIGTGLIPATIAVKGDEDTRDLRRGRRVYWKTGQLPWALSFAEDNPDRFVEFCLPDCKPEDDDLMIGDAVFCAPILERLTKRQSKIGCLILKCVGGEQYRRVGFCVLCKENPAFRKDAQHEGTLDASMRTNAENHEGHAFRYSQETEVRIVIV